jgi:hypothetical protein
MSNIPTRSAALELARSLMIADPELGINSILNFLHEETSRKDRTLCMDVTRCLSRILATSSEAQIAFAKGRGFRAWRNRKFIRKKQKNGRHFRTSG